MDWAKLYSSEFFVVFVAAFLLFAYWETVRPLRTWATESGRRWRRHGLLLVLSVTVSTLILRTTPVALAMALEESGPHGLLQQPLLRSWLPHWALILLAFVLIDAALYFSHRALHVFPWLWRIHRVHHSDLEFDVTTSAREHPLDTVIQSATVSGMVYLLGAPSEGVALSQFLVALNSFWIHANIDVPERVLTFLQRWIMTPRLHTVHHSQLRVDNDSNFGDVLVVWDRLLKTYRPEPAEGFAGLKMGLPGMDLQRNLNIGEMILSPLRPTGSAGPARSPAPETLV